MDCRLFQLDESQLTLRLQAANFPNADTYIRGPKGGKMGLGGGDCVTLIPFIPTLRHNLTYPLDNPRNIT